MSEKKKQKKQIALILTGEEYQRLRQLCAARNMGTIPDSQIARVLVLNQLDREEEQHEQHQSAARMGVAGV